MTRHLRLAALFALLVGVLLLMVLAIPLFGAADENQHLTMAYAVNHGEWSAGSSRAVVEAPSIYTGDLPCFALRPNRSASCQELVEDGPDHRVSTSASSYPPTYYLLVGWPTRFSTGVLSLYLVRVVSAVLVALLLTLAFDSLVRVGRQPAPLLVGLSVAVTPAVVFFGAVVNPSGLAIAASLAAWAGGLLLVRGPADRLRWATVRFALPLGLVLLLRRDSLYWGALVAVAVLALARGDRLRALVRRPATWVAVGWLLASRGHLVRAGRVRCQRGGWSRRGPARQLLRGAG